MNEQISEQLIETSPQALRQIQARTESFAVLAEVLEDSLELPEAPVDNFLCVHELFEQQVKLTPAAVALAASTGFLCYQELNERANQLAAYLLSEGVGRESLVGVCLERSFEMIISLLAILKAGGAYLPLDPTYPPDRLSFMIEDSGVKVLLTEQGLLDRVLDHQARVICLDSHADTIGRESKENPVSSALDKNLAYMIYTSGSTGKPKGVLVQHGGVPNLARAQAQGFRVGPDSRVLQFASMSFDASVSEIFKTLLAGARLYVEPGTRALSGPDLNRFLREQEITVVTLPPSVLATLKFEELPALRTLVVAGEACPPDLVDRWSRGRHFLNAYGPTEITVCATMGECSETGGRPPIGYPMQNITVHVLDSNLQTLPTGEVGELYLGGVGLARGYHHQPELTAEKFIPNPFSDEPGSRLYRTGDWGFYLPDGQLEFIGRIDDQVKIRGFRIEPGEIEDSLSRHPEVQTGVVVAREDERGEKQLVAYVVAEAGATLSGAELKAYLKEQLPEHLVPTTFTMLASLPLLPNGKIDRRALLAMPVAKPTIHPSAVAPQTLLEKLLARLWSEILGIDSVGAEDNFFDVGGDSLKAARFLNRLQEELGEVVYVVALFDAPTVAGLSAYLQRHYPDAVARLTGQDWQAGNLAVTQRIDAARLNYVRNLIKPLAPPNFDLKPKNRPAIFILSPPRSGSTLLRVMLAGHHELFAPPELQLLCCNSLQDRKATFSGRYSFWLEGTIRALMDIKGCDAETAKDLMSECEDRNLTTPEFYSFMQELIEPRKLVDKTPAYALDLETLKRAEECFDEPLYIHLLRHPNGMIRSFEDAKLDQIFRYEHNLSTRELAECIWTICHQNITEFLKGVSPQRLHVVQFEELVKQPGKVLEELCLFLGLEFDEKMIEPHAEQGKKMTDGIHGLSRMLGDIKFHTHQKVEAGIADRWKQASDHDFLGEVTWQMATSLGYPKQATANSATRVGNLTPIKTRPRRKRQA
jgi:amino acid adenylation domain-containing protein